MRLVLVTKNLFLLNNIIYANQIPGQSTYTNEIVYFVSSYVFMRPHDYSHK